jgi:hypothetical protein
VRLVRLATIDPGHARRVPKQGRNDPRARRDLHGLDANGMVACNPRDREAAHRAEAEGIATTSEDAVTCRKCLEILHRDRRGQRS